MATTITHEEAIEGTEATHSFGTWTMEPTDKGFWHSSAPKRIASGHRPGDPGVGWEAWTHHLRNRRRPVPLEKLFSCRDLPLFWSLPTARIAAATARTLFGSSGAELQRALDTAAIETIWPDSLGKAEPTVDEALTLLSIVHRLPDAATELDTNHWWRLLERLVAWARDAAMLTADAKQDPLTGLAIQLVAGELPVTLAYQFPEICPCRSLRKTGAKALSAGLVELCDGEGMMPYRLIDVQRPIAACWTRCLGMATAMKRSCWSEDAQTQFEWHVRQTIRLARANGEPLLSDLGGIGWSPDQFVAMIQLAGDASDAVAAQSLPRKVITKSAIAKSAAPPEPSANSEWAELTVLRSGWQRGAPRVAIGCDGPRMVLELENRRQTVLYGVWDLDVRVADRKRLAQATWEEVCWYSDDEVDYFELTIGLSGSGSVERQILLAKEDKFLLLADNITTERGAGIEYRGRLPMARGIAFQGEKKTRDGCLMGPDPLASVLPLAVPEWRCDQRKDNLLVEEEALVLQQKSPGRSLNCPLFFDLWPQRMARERTWRQLTVAESLEIQSNEVAVGYRIQCGKRQWILYRSLAQCGNRTLLGQNLSSEFFMGRFLSDGTTKELIEIEHDEESE